jgi:hypothetical protein
MLALCLSRVFTNFVDPRHACTALRRPPPSLLHCELSCIRDNLPQPLSQLTTLRCLAVRHALISEGLLLAEYDSLASLTGGCRPAGRGCHWSAPHTSHTQTTHTVTYTTLEAGLLVTAPLPCPCAGLTSLSLEYQGEEAWLPPAELLSLTKLRHLSIEGNNCS